MTLIVDTLRGSNNAKVKRCRMDENVHYGKTAHLTIPRLRQMINHLILNDYLILTTGEYAVVKLGVNAKELTDGDSDVTVTMKMAKEYEPVSKDSKKAAGKARVSKAVASLDDVDRDLFEKLRELRMELAKEAGVPPYLIFSDKTLTQMCLASFQ